MVNHENGPRLLRRAGHSEAMETKISLTGVTYDDREDAILIHTLAGHAVHGYAIPGKLVEAEPNLKPIAAAAAKAIAEDYAGAGIDVQAGAIQNQIGIKLALFRDAGPKSLS